MDNGLPKGWIQIELRDHVYIAGRIGWRGLKAEEYTHSGPILLSVHNLNQGDDVSFAEVDHISSARYDESPEIQLCTGDTLLVKVEPHGPACHTGAPTCFFRSFDE